MLTPVARRSAIIGGLSVLVASGVAVGMAPVGAAPTHSAALAKAKIFSASLNGVSVAPHSKTAWALGSQTVKKGTTYTVSFYGARSKGHSWSRLGVKAPTGAQLSSIAATSPGSAWMFGLVYGATANKPLVEHSTGGTFKPVHNTLPAGNLISSSASSPSNIWVIDSTATGTIAAHGNGHHWKQEKFTGDNVNLRMSAVSASSPSNVWILASDGTNPIAAHWNGHTFSFSTISVPAGATVTGIATASPKSTWVLGATYVTKPSGQTTHTLVEHWNGHKWAKVAAPSPGTGVAPASITASGSHAYIAGASYGKSSPRGLNEHAMSLSYSHGHWKVAHVAKQGVTSQFFGISESSKATVAVGASFNGYQCGSDTNVVSSPLVETTSGTSFSRGNAPKLRRAAGSAHLRMAPTAPGVRSC